MCPQKATNTSQLVKSCSCQEHPVSGTSTKVRKGQLGQAAQMMVWLQAITYHRRQTASTMDSAMPQHCTAALQTQHYLVSTAVNTL